MLTVNIYILKTWTSKAVKLTCLSLFIYWEQNLHETFVYLRHSRPTVAIFVNACHWFWIWAGSGTTYSLLTVDSLLNGKCVSANRMSLVYWIFLDAAVTFRGWPLQVINFINPVQTCILEMTISPSYGDIKEHPFFQCE